MPARAPPGGSAASRRRAERGRVAELAVADYLFVRGFDVLATNLRVGRDEIDILAREGRVIAVVEVRTRGPGSWRSALGSVDHGKRDRLARAATRLWRQRFVKDESVDRIRIDLAGVTFEASGEVIVDYVTAAFLASRR